MKIFITGASGFIGRQLVTYLLHIGSTTGQTLEILTGSRDTDYLQALKGVDVVVHLAAKVHDMQGGQPAEYIQTNVDLTLQIAKAAQACGVKRFIFMSSIKAMGEERDTAYQETDIPCPLDPYGVSKLMAEQALLQMAEASELEVVILRPPLVYGPGVKANFQALIKLVKKGLPLPFKSIHNQRSFVYVENLCDMIYRCLQHPAAKNQIFLACDDSTFSTPDLVKAIGQAMQKTVRLWPVPVAGLKLIGRLSGKSQMLGRLINSLELDNSKIKHWLGWQPIVTPMEGLKKTIAE